VIIDGKVVNGSTGNAGEIGHICVKAKGPRCGCGRRGCMEALASRSAMARRVGKAIQKGAMSLLPASIATKPEKLKSKDLAAAFGAGDPVVVKEVHRAAHYLGVGLGSLMNVLGPQMIIIGGGVAAALGERYVEVVRASAHEQCLSDPEGKIKVALAALGDDAGILGAALLARERFVV
jgi:glucokinase